MPTGRLSSIQCLRALAAIVVVLHHQGIEAGLNAVSGITSPFIPNFWGLYGVDLFFVISGFIMTYVFQKNFGKPDAWSRFLLQRVLRIYPIYWQFSLLGLLFLYETGAAGLIQDGYPAYVLRSFLLLPQWQGPILQVGWTLIFEMFFYLAFGIAFVLPRNLLRFAFCGWAIFILATAFTRFCPVAPSPTVYLVTSPLALEFILGCFVAWLLLKGFTIKLRYPLIIALLWYMVAIICVPLPIYSNGADTLKDFQAFRNFNAFRVITFGVPAALIVYAVVAAERLNIFQFPRWLRSLGDASYSIYLSHTVVLTFLYAIWGSLHIGGGIAQGVFVTSAFVVAVVVGIINFRLVENPLMIWCHKRLS